VLGHECLARIEARGLGVESLEVGDLVVPVVRRPLGTPHRRVDLLPFGQYTERGIVREHGFSTPWWLDRPEFLFRVPTEVAPIAVFAEPLAVAEKGVNEAIALQRGRLGDGVWRNPLPRALVTGLGPIAFAAVIAARARGWPVTVYGRDAPDSFRAQLAARFGARYVAAADADLSPSDVERDGYDLLLECTGSDEVLLTAARSVASCGVLVWLGSSRVPRPQSLNVALLMRDGILRNHVHVGTVNAAARDFHDALDHLSALQETHAAALANLITARVSPADALWHYEHREPQGIKTVVVY
jgi:threonine dehydrogenase-like Zn-dependent dehydrogenase